MDTYADLLLSNFNAISIDTDITFRVGPGNKAAGRFLIATLI